MQILVGHTYEMIDPELAVEEILQQLDLDSTQLANSLGIITCFPIFIQTGVFKALCDALPFAVVGVTTLGNSVRDAYGSLMPMLSIMVLTSNETSFALAKSSSLNASETSPLVDISEHNAVHAGKAPSMAMAFIPQPTITHAAAVLDSFQKSIGVGIPIFGMVACEPEMKDTSRVLYQGEALCDVALLILIYGDIKPRFLMMSVPDAHIQTKEAVITAASGAILQEVNGMPFVEYMATIGLNAEVAFHIFPLIMDYKNGTKPIARGIYTLTPEGYAICGGDVPLNGTLAIGRLDAKDLLTTADSFAKTISELPDIQGAFIVSCVGRNFTLVNDPTQEMKALYSVLGDSIPYMGCYSAGEIAPLQNQKGEYINFLHNYSIIACVF